MKRILILEDDDEKFSVVDRLIRKLFAGNYLKRVFSVNEAQQMIKTEAFEIAIIDMSVPMFTGRPSFRGDLESLGGEMVIREIFRRKLPIKCLLVSGFDEFLYHGKEVTFEELLLELMKRFPQVVGGVYYSSGRRGFSEDLRDLLSDYL